MRLHRHDDGRVEQFVRRRRHYQPFEAAGLLAKFGLCLAGVWNGYDPALPYGSRPEGIVIAVVREDGGGL